MRRPAAHLRCLLPLLAALGGSSPLLAQGRERLVECSSLLFSGCRNYVIEVVRVEPDGTPRPQGDKDTYQEANPDTLDPGRFLVVLLYDGDRLSGNRSVIWVDRRSGVMGGDWPEHLSNDQVRSAEIHGVPGDVVELYDDRTKLIDRGMTRLVIFAGDSSCRAEVNLDVPSGGKCSSVEGRTVAGKVSGIVIEYRGIGTGGSAAATPAPRLAESAAPRASPDSRPGLLRAAGAPRLTVVLGRLAQLVRARA